MKPALQQVDHLKLHVVIMRNRDLCFVERLGHTNHMRLHQSTRRWREAEVAAGGIVAETGVEVPVGLPSRK
jgi:hypothetical protein